MDQLMIGVSGIRGIIGSALLPEMALKFAQSFGTFAGGGRVVLARDTRTTGEMLARAVSAGLMAAGCDVIDIGIAATPTCSLMVDKHRASGGVMISASHNPPEWNGLKFFGRDARFLDTDSGNKVVDIFKNSTAECRDYRGVGAFSTDATAGEYHVEKVLGILDVDAIKAKGFTVLLDANHGAGGAYTPMLLERLGCEAVLVGGEPDGQFAHPPEPTAAHLKDVCGMVKDKCADVGFAQDPDADRLAVIDETGTYIGEEYSLALAAAHVMATKAGPAVANLSTSRMIDDIAARHNQQVLRTPVGEAHVAQGMVNSGAVVGGEGNGGVMDPRVHPARDSLVGMGLILESLARTGKTVSGLVSDLPKYMMEKIKIDCPRAAAEAVFAALDDAFGDARRNTDDGIRYDWDDAWVHVRLSNTEPVMRLIAEAGTVGRLEELLGKARTLAQEIVG